MAYSSVVHGIKGEKMLNNEQLQEWADMTPTQAPAPCVVQLAKESLIVRNRLYRQAETIEALDKSRCGIHYV